MSQDTLNINVNLQVKNPSIFGIQKLLLSPLEDLNLSRAHKIIHFYWADSESEARGSIFVIEVPPKIWSPKVQNKYTPPDYAIDINHGVFDFDFYGKTVFCPKQIWKKIQQNYLIPFTKDLHQKELQKNLHVRLDLDSKTCARVTNFVINYWDWFCKEGAWRMISVYNFSIDTGTAKPVFCRKPQYGPYESKIVMLQIKALLHNKWIE